MRGMKKKTLEIRLQKLVPYSVNVELEQYNTPADIAADVLCLAFSFGDVEDRKVVELGCGNGIFAIGAKLLGARKAIGIDIDRGAIDIAIKNMERLEAEVNFINSDVIEFSERCDTVVQNPPFGAQKTNKHADLLFVRKAFDIANVVYSLHLAKTVDFVMKCFESCGASVTMTKSYKFPIPHTYKFHKKEKRDFDVIMVRGVKDEQR